MEWKAAKIVTLQHFNYIQVAMNAWMNSSYAKLQKKPTRFAAKFHGAINVCGLIRLWNQKITITSNSYGGGKQPKNG